MRGKIAVIGAIWLIGAFSAGAAQAGPPAQCEVPQSLIETDTDLARVMAEVKDQHRLNISVIGSGSSSLPGPDGAHFAYPARLEDALKQQLSGIEIKVTAHVQSREAAAAMIQGMGKILSDEKPALVIWQTGTADALSGVEPETFRSTLEQGIEKIQGAGADVILMNMQYSPRTESMLDVSTYAEVMKVVAEQRGALLFDRFAIMQNWNSDGTFDLYTATKKYDMARRVHDCIGWALASQILNTAHLDAVRMQTTR